MENSKKRKLGCLVMAAGNAARFGENKLAAVYDGKSLIVRALSAVPKELFSLVTVVTQYPEVEALAKQFGFTAVKNPHPDWGISHTIYLGTEAMLSCDAILYMVSDQPLLCKDSVRQVIGHWSEHPDCIVGAAHDGKRGNPCIFPKEFFPELMELKEDHGGNTVIRRYPERLRLVEIGKQELTDIDTPQALHDLKNTITEP